MTTLTLKSTITPEQALANATSNGQFDYDGAQNYLVMLDTFELNERQQAAVRMGLFVVPLATVGGLEKDNRGTLRAWLQPAFEYYLTVFGTPVLDPGSIPVSQIKPGQFDIAQLVENVYVRKDLATPSFYYTSESAAQRMGELRGFTLDDIIQVPTVPRDRAKTNYRAERTKSDLHRAMSDENNAFSLARRGHDKDGGMLERVVKTSTSTSAIGKVGRFMGSLLTD